MGELQRDEARLKFVRARLMWLMRLHDVRPKAVVVAFSDGMYVGYPKFSNLRSQGSFKLIYVDHVVGPIERLARENGWDGDYGRIDELIESDRRRKEAR